jgi:hypothetical protein
VATLTRVSLVCTLERAKWVAYNTCVKKGGAAGQFYQDDFHEIAWATNAYLAFAIEERDPLDLPRDYEPVYGWAFAKLANRPPNNALQQCYAANPSYNGCKAILIHGTDEPFDPAAFDGGSWHTPTVPPIY